MKYVNTELLIPHEKINIINLELIIKIIKLNNNNIFKPIIIDKNTFVVLDGHHRLYAAKELGINKIPVVFMDYYSDDIILESKDGINKEYVINNAINGNLLLPKSTYHYIIKDGKKIHISDIL